ncbi:hypothetical protein LTR86_003663 [Recurvomyces mirabilis]|nr:hypothetical protein LTR86_003663 [Recurvomyces mirabilis]
MLSNGAHPVSVTDTNPYERPTSRLNYQPTQGYSQRNTIELPRPLEPRPSLQTSLSESSGSHRHHASASVPEYRPAGHSLPGLRDILPPGSHGGGSSGFSTSWVNSAASTTSHRSYDGYYPPSGIHPPLALHPPNEHPAHYPTGRRVELPVLESNPVSRLSLQSLPISPYAGFSENRDYADTRPDIHRQASATSYQANAIHSPYASVPDDVSYRNALAAYEGSGDDPGGLANAEPQRKYLGVKEVVGEGSFHVYEGGFRIPTQVEGETVNPAWGLTKANKPRKRLALACLDCREKKIKCEPGASSCLQCEKAKRPCRRAPIQSGLPESTPAPTSWHSGMSSPVCKGTSNTSPMRSKDFDPEVVSKRRSRDDPSPPDVPTKKQRSTSPNAVAHAGATSHNDTYGAMASSNMAKMVQRSDPMLTWDEDPYNVDSALTMHVLDLYFTHINNAAYTFYSKPQFMAWVASEKDKCQLERMALYSILAVGSLFAGDQYSGFGKCCAEIAKGAVAQKIGTFNLAVVHARLLLSLYHAARGSDGMAWDYAGSAIRTCLSSTLGYQTEEACLYRDQDQHRIEFGLAPNQLAECRRRTFWSCFLLDRFAYGSTCTISTADIFVRLPCTDGDYDRGLASNAPHFNNGIIDPQKAQLQPQSPVSPMAWLCLISSIWGDVLNFSNRTVHRPSNAFSEAYETFYVETYNRLHSWSSCLPEYLQYTENNLARSVHTGYGPIFVSAHALYHFTFMRLNRCVKFQCFGQTRVERNIRAAHMAANALLDMMHSLRLLKRPSHDGGYDPVDSVISAPYLGNSILSAIDIISAGGFDSHIGRTLDSVGGGVECLREAATYWNTARNHFSSSQKRLLSMQNIMTRPTKTQAGAWLGRKWGMKDPLEKDFVNNRNHDCIYGLEDQMHNSYFDALSDEAQRSSQRSGSMRVD